MNPDHMTLKLSWDEVEVLRTLLEEYRLCAEDVGVTSPIADSIWKKMDEFTLNNIDPFAVEGGV